MLDNYLLLHIWAVSSINVLTYLVDFLEVHVLCPIHYALNNYYLWVIFNERRMKQAISLLSCVVGRDRLTLIITICKHCNDDCVSFFLDLKKIFSILTTQIIYLNIHCQSNIIMLIYFILRTNNIIFIFVKSISWKIIFTYYENNSLYQ